jgi:hypothetical protein
VDKEGKLYFFDRSHGTEKTYLFAQKDLKYVTHLFAVNQWEERNREALLGPQICTTCHEELPGPGYNLPNEIRTAHRAKHEKGLERFYKEGHRLERDAMMRVWKDHDPELRRLEEAVGQAYTAATGHPTRIETRKDVYSLTGERRTLLDADTGQSVYEWDNLSDNNPEDPKRKAVTKAWHDYLKRREEVENESKTKGGKASNRYFKSHRKQMKRIAALDGYPQFKPKLACEPEPPVFQS